MKRIIALVMVFALIFALGACGGGAEEPAESGDAADTVYEFRMSTDEAPEQYTVGLLNDAVAAIEERTEGNVKISVYPGGQLGSYNSMYSSVMAGDVEMQMNYVDTAYDPRFACFIFPGVFSGYDEFLEVMDEGTFMWNLMEDILGNMNMECLGIGNTGLMGIGTVKEPATNFADAVDYGKKKDVLIRIPAMDNYLCLINDMGYRTTTIAYADLYPALQTGVADGWMGGTAVLNYMSFRDVIKYFIDAQTNSEPLLISMNKGALAQLPEEYQAIVKEEMKTLGINISTQAEEEAQKSIDAMAEMGITIIEGTQEEHDALVANIRETTWPQLEEMIGTETYEGLVAAFGVE